MSELKNYAITVRITDKYRKPDHLQGVKTDERVFWEDTVEMKNCESEEQAKLAIALHYSKQYPIKKYTVNIVSIRETLIIPDQKLIIPE